LNVEGIKLNKSKSNEESRNQNDIYMTNNILTAKIYKILHNKHTHQFMTSDEIVIVFRT
jgi:hypothetical protein